MAGGECLAERVAPELRAAVSSLATQATRVASVCTGAFVLAELGWLDGRRATTQADSPSSHRHCTDRRHAATHSALMESVAADPAAEHTVPAMASRLGVSARHLNRLFRTETGTTPARWIEEARVDAARALLLEGHPVSRVAQLSGLGSDETLRRAFARHLGTTPTVVRDRFSTTRQAPGTPG